jgi:hypothetical protein
VSKRSRKPFTCSIFKWFQVSGFKCQVSDVGFLISGLGVRVSGFAHWVDNKSACGVVE